MSAALASAYSSTLEMSKLERSEAKNKGHPLHRPETGPRDKGSLVTVGTPKLNAVGENNIPYHSCLIDRSIPNRHIASRRTFCGMPPEVFSSATACPRLVPLLTPRNARCSCWAILRGFRDARIKNKGDESCACRTAVARCVGSHAHQVGDVRRHWIQARRIERHSRGRSRTRNGQG
jgi:hypothetical protein